MSLEIWMGDFPGGPAVTTLRFHRRGHGFDPWSGDEDPTCLVAQQKEKKKKKMDGTSSFVYLPPDHILSLFWCLKDPVPLHKLFSESLLHFSFKDKHIHLVPQFLFYELYQRSFCIYQRQRTLIAEAECQSFVPSLVTRLSFPNQRAMSTPHTIDLSGST